MKCKILANFSIQPTRNKISHFDSAKILTLMVIFYVRSDFRRSMIWRLLFRCLKIFDDRRFDFWRLDLHRLDIRWFDIRIFEVR